MEKEQPIRKRSVYEQMLLMANHYDLPKAYKNDLFVHDKKWLEEHFDPKHIFGWTLGECGTHVVDTRMARKDLEGYLSHFSVDGRSLRYFTVKNEVLFEHDFLAFCDILREAVGTRNHAL